MGRYGKLIPKAQHLVAFQKQKIEQRKKQKKISVLKQTVSIKMERMRWVLKNPSWNILRHFRALKVKRRY